MAYITRTLIIRAYELAGIVARDAETVSGSQMTEGLEMLNAVIGVKSAQERWIPYFSEYNFNTVAGTNSYFIPDLLKSETVTFEISTVRYQMMEQSRREFFGSGRAVNVESLPGVYHLERELGGSTLFFYYVPNAVYPITIWGKFALSDVTLDQDLSLTVERYYIEYLRYALASYLCDIYPGVSLTDSAIKRLASYEEFIIDTSPIDLTTKKISCFTDAVGVNYALANFPNTFLPG